MDISQITHWCHEVIRSFARPGGTYIDATMGKGNDTIFLARLAGEDGRVLAFDIQEAALKITEKKLRENCLMDKVRLILDGHEYMERYAAPDTVDVICFNFGYLPGGDHKIATKSDTSIAAIRQGLTLLKPGGMMSLCIYSGGDTGFEEKDKVLEFLKGIPSKEFTVIVNRYYNRINNPPIPVFIFRQ